MKKVHISPIIHYDEKRIKLLYHYKNGDVIDTLVRELPGRRWSETKKCWHIPYTDNYKKYLTGYFNKYNDVTVVFPDSESNRAWVYIYKSVKKIALKFKNHTELHNKIEKLDKSYFDKSNNTWFLDGTDNKYYDEIISLLKKFRFDYSVKEIIPEWEKDNTLVIQTFVNALKVKKYSNKTIDAYYPYFRQFVDAFANRDIEKLEYYHLKNYVTDQTERNNYSEIQQRHLISAIKFYYEKILGWHKIYFKLQKSYDFEIKPIVLELDVLKKYLNKVIKTSEKLLLLLHYGFGFSTQRISELSLDDIKQVLKQEIQAMDLLADLKKTVIEYYQVFSPSVFLFEKQGGQTYSQEEIQNVINKLTGKYQIVEAYSTDYMNFLNQTDIGEKTKKNYVSGFLSFLKHYAFKHPANISNDEIRLYVLDCSEKLKLSSSYIGNQITTIRFYYKHIEKRFIEQKYLLRPRRGKKNPTVLAVSEIIRMIELTDNIKHKNMIALLYAAGLRRSELLNMRMHHIDFERNVINIRGGKGNKDRQIPLADNTKLFLLPYIEEYQPNDYVFEGATGGKYSGSSIEKVIKNAAHRANITKNVTPHVLRHSYATHLMENAVDIRYIQKLLGHSSIKTTERYTHVSNTGQAKVKSPIDNINFNASEQTKPP